MYFEKFSKNVNPFPDNGTIFFLLKSAYKIQMDINLRWFDVGYADCSWNRKQGRESLRIAFNTAVACAPKRIYPSEHLQSKESFWVPTVLIIWSRKLYLHITAGRTMATNRLRKTCKVFGRVRSCSEVFGDATPTARSYIFVTSRSGVVGGESSAQFGNARALPATSTSDKFGITRAASARSELLGAASPSLCQC